jgi:hypothetical protein
MGTGALLGPLASLTRVDACNPLLQAHPTWARDEHEGRGIPTSLSRRTPASSLLSPFTLAHALDPSGLGHAAHSLVGLGTPGLETPTPFDFNCFNLKKIKNPKNYEFTLHIDGEALPSFNTAGGRYAVVQAMVTRRTVWL